MGDLKGHFDRLVFNKPVLPNHQSGPASYWCSAENRLGTERRVLGLWEPKEPVLIQALAPNQLWNQLIKYCTVWVTLAAAAPSVSYCSGFRRVIIASCWFTSREIWSHYLRNSVRFLKLQFGSTQAELTVLEDKRSASWVLEAAPTDCSRTYFTTLSS